jgi:GNAT superfamily N-acetyltransferase
MKYEVVADPAEFRDQAALLLADEARHNLILGVLGTLLHSPEVYPDNKMFLVRDGDIAVAAALMTRPYNLIVTDTEDKLALEALVAGVREDGIDVPGVIANRPTVDWLVAAWDRAAGSKARRLMAQGVFALEKVATVESASGSAQIAVPGDSELIADWTREFIAEALPEEPHDDEQMQKAIARRLGGETPGAYWVWSHSGQPVSLSGHGNPTGRGIRIGPVYTPQQHRGNGYASSLVAAESRWLVDNGYDFCFLFTDLANPTSNAIYERIGYRQVAEAASYVFEAEPRS